MFLEINVDQVELPAARMRTLSFLASFCVAGGSVLAAEGHLLELLAWCAFADRAAESLQ